VGSGKTLAAGVAAGLLVLKACEREGPLARALASPLPRWLGRYSYSFFLVHYIVVHRWSGWVSERVPPADRAAHALVFLAGALAISLAASVVLWNVAERFYFRRPAAGAR